MFRFLFITLWLSSAMIFAQPRSSNDSSGVGEFINAFNAAWNSHNPKAIADFWVGDGDLITPWGRWIISKSQIESHFEQEKKGMIQQSIDSKRFLTPQFAYLDTTIKLNFTEQKENSPPAILQHGVYLLGKVGNEWKIISLRIFQFQSTGPNSSP